MVGWCLPSRMKTPCLNYIISIIPYAPIPSVSVFGGGVLVPRRILTGYLEHLGYIMIYLCVSFFSFRILGVRFKLMTLHQRSPTWGEHANVSYLRCVGQWFCWEFSWQWELWWWAIFSRLPAFRFFFGAKNVFKVGKLRCKHLVAWLFFITLEWEFKLWSSQFRMPETGSFGRLNLAAKVSAVQGVFFLNIDSQCGISLEPRVQKRASNLQPRVGACHIESKPSITDVFPRTGQTNQKLFHWASHFGTRHWL